MASSEVSIKSLPITTQVINGDFLIVETTNATSRLDFENFVVGLDNTTFKDTVEANTSNVQTISTVLFTAPVANANAYQTADIKGLPITIDGVNYQILLSSAIQ